MRYILDTNIVSAVMKSDATVIARLRQQNRRDVLLAQPVVAEIEYGLARLTRSKRQRLLQERFEVIRGTFERVDWTDAVSAAFGEIKAVLERKGRPIEDFDAAIAAHALANTATLVTGNTKHMAGVPNLAVEDWLAQP